MLKITKPHYVSEPTSITFDEGRVRIGAYTVIEASEDNPICIKGDCDIGHHCLLSNFGDVKESITIGKNSEIGSYCSVLGGTTIGPHTKILYGAKIFENVLIGERCVVGSDVSNWTKIGNDVTYMGAIVHSNRKVGRINEWNTLPLPSPTIENSCFIGEKAMLIGGIIIGIGSYVAAGEIVRCNVPKESLFMKSKITPISAFRGMIRTM